MKNPIFLSAGIALTLVSCAGDADTAARKKSVTIGRFGVIHNAATSEVAAADATVAAPAQGASADPNAAAGQQQAVPEPAKQEAGKAVAKEPAAPSGRNAASNDGIRLPSMLGLPEDKDLKATNPTVPKSNEGGAVISRPPTEKKD